MNGKAHEIIAFNCKRGLGKQGRVEDEFRLMVSIASVNNACDNKVVHKGASNTKTENYQRP